ncbi:glycosyltransferase family protein [Caulobacter segnis]|uniref:glycosyltransferase family protein n=1 Tax=Caulobacter segnis TaxID=88688 RepID=UPI00240F99E2|nr:glycosyltransferase family protein [Caulobacter segnis]MDG2522834.1 glycosyltransferase family protein [Caulobacter segnis]
MTTVAITQARMTSERLPGKILKPLAGQPLLARHLARLSRAGRIDRVVVGSPEGPVSDPIRALCAPLGFPVVDGPEDDVLARFLNAARFAGADIIVRVTSDCPFIDPELVDLVVARRAETGVDYATLDAPGVYPRGLDVEVFTRAALETAAAEAASTHDREHVTPFIRNQPDRFTTQRVAADGAGGAYRLCVDTPADLALAERLYDHFGGDDFGWREVVSVLDARPDWAALNSDVIQKAV